MPPLPFFESNLGRRNSSSRPSASFDPTSLLLLWPHPRNGQSGCRAASSFELRSRPRRASEQRFHFICGRPKLCSCMLHAGRGQSFCSQTRPRKAFTRCVANLPSLFALLRAAQLSHLSSPPHFATTLPLTTTESWSRRVVQRLDLQGRQHPLKALRFGDNLCSSTLPPKWPRLCHLVFTCTDLPLHLSRSDSLSHQLIDPAHPN